MSFASFDLHHTLKSNVGAMGYTRPTPIQSEAIPVILAGRDVLGLAQTGTGKTAAFGLPMLDRLRSDPKRGLRGLVIAPTRELAEQIHDALLELGGGGIRRSLVTIYGGVGMQPQVERLAKGAQIAVACPGRLLDHIQRGTIDLRNLEVLVLDEADQMFDMGFLPTIREIIRHLPDQRQNLLFSATMPEEIRSLAGEILKDPVTVEIGLRAPVETVAHALYPVPGHLKAGLLLELMKTLGDGSVLVFVRTKHRARRVGEQLLKAGFKAASIQGNLSQNRRQAAMDGFRNGTYRILVATDIAARGIDVAGITHVINFDIPDTVDAYTHRIGRTGRATCNGDAFTFITPDDNAMVRRIEFVLKTQIERRTIEGFDYSVPAPPVAESANRRDFRRPERGGQRHGQPGAGPQRPGQFRGQSHARGPNSFRVPGGAPGVSRPRPANGDEDDSALQARAEAMQPTFNSGPRPVVLTSHQMQKPGAGKPGRHNFGQKHPQGPNQARAGRPQMRRGFGRPGGHYAGGQDRTR